MKPSPRIIVAKRIGVERPATRKEVCQHWMVTTNASCGGNVFRRCAFGCGHADSVPREAV